MLVRELQNLGDVGCLATGVTLLDLRLQEKAPAPGASTPSDPRSRHVGRSLACGR